MFWQKKKQAKAFKQELKTLVADTAYALDAFSAESSDELLDRLQLSRAEAYSAVSSDDEVESCKEDLRTAMTASGWRLYGEGTDDAQTDRIYRCIRRHLGAFVELVLTARLNGYAVGRYVWKVEEDGFITLDKVRDRRDELEKYVPQRDGGLKYRGENGEELVDTNVLHLFLANKPTAKNPAGEMTVARLYPAVALRKQGIQYAYQFIKRYGQPYLVGRYANALDDNVKTVYGLINGGAATLSSEDSIEMLTNPATGSAFGEIEKLANARIQKLLLGKVKTSELNSGSRSAQQIEENARQDRIEAYLTLLSLAVQHAVDALLMVNAQWGVPVKHQGGLWFEFNEEIKVDKARAERDKIYADIGQLRFTEEYYEKVLGFEPEHYELAQNPQRPSENRALSARFSDTGVSDGLSAAEAADRAIMQPKVAAILSALAEADGYAAFQTALNQMDLSENDLLLVDKLVGESVRAFAEGQNE
ncbi:Mu-like prophage protein gp29 [Kingella potus]|uniref:Mu-like prophage protein gp29 n=1 Tax=Kingella potus TaxID=265175 RepID=A0A377R780_9NEIS|nr:DUF935 family protein [Kingella potus]UOP00542.1 DUF935 domain-containing protein [Kingella potus]UOP02006.1 DUF935 domain-containing protein [Kingella potus]STQ99837.1 Mu-like prophage protein gp29 [Kingella potus]STR03415.1 Mu-like prophage protein gp29 [Kingella potus]